MKKTLIALAVLAASGASFAQVTITGNLTMGYLAQTTAGQNGVGANDTAGFGTDTSEINFAAVEDLGGGMKITAKMGLSGADRSMEGRGAGTSPAGAAAGSFVAGVRGTDASLAMVLGTSGTIAISSAQSPDYLTGGPSLAGLGAYYMGFDNKVFSKRTNRDVVSYTSPAFSGFTLSTSYQETSGAGSQGLGVGTTGTNSVAAAAGTVNAAATTGQSLSTYGATYGAGALAANITYLNFNSSNAAGLFKNQLRLSGAYDFGIAKLGLGYVATTATGAANAVDPKLTDMTVGVLIPMGKFTLGTNLVSRKFDDVASIGGNAGTSTGSGFQASYALSKRTAVLASYGRFTQTTTTGITAGQDVSSEYLFALSHSF